MCERLRQGRAFDLAVGGGVLPPVWEDSVHVDRSPLDAGAARGESHAHCDGQRPRRATDPSSGEHGRATVAGASVRVSAMGGSAPAVLAGTCAR